VSASALKGRRIPAQGATLGMRGPPVRRSEGTPQRVGLGRRPLFKNMRRSFRTPGDAVTVPRALPWAGMRCPVGTPGADPVLPITATPAPASSSHVRSFRVPVPDFAKALGGFFPLVARQWPTSIALDKRIKYYSVRLCSVPRGQGAASLPQSAATSPTTEEKPDRPSCQNSI